MSFFYAKDTLPENYAEAEKIDLVKNKKQMLLVNGLALVLTALLILLGVLFQPEGAMSMFDLQENAFHMALKCLVVCIGILVYIAGHEAVHGAFMWHYSRIRPNFGFAFTYAYAGSNCYFAKGAYLVIALAPLVLWGVLLVVLTLLLPAEWFWVVWAIQIMNVSGAAGDLFVFVRILRKPQHVLVQDTGTSMTVFL